MFSVSFRERNMSCPSEQRDFILSFSSMDLCREEVCMWELKTNQRGKTGRFLPVPRGNVQSGSCEEINRKDSIALLRNLRRPVHCMCDKRFDTAFSATGFH